ncbi:ASCH domain-containing protein [Fretibacterium sp. OH1220_COT-178]|uniref:ASCH domain-containing protein n=1 Tax=Fretibacterium sp. OH1220_COT-178 TaxID=2491047 RepID=UPI0013159EDD|nr:ASCH domain-containing protein [Fretibacterium sp. OH1220_COT-178]
MKALSVKQPFAEFIATGEKILELWTWKTDYRGPLLICASSQGNLSLGRGATKEEREEFEREFPNGVAVCVVDLTEIEPYPSRTEAPEEALKFAECVGERQFCAILGEDFDLASFEYEGYAWLLTNPRRVPKPFPVKGKLHLFNVEYEE